MITSGLEGVLPLLACPHCAKPLERIEERVAGCRNRHRFDVARQGYLSLLGPGSRTDTADSADMVAARTEFLAGGHFRPVADAIADRVSAGPVVDIGAGTGYHLGIALDRLGGHGSDGSARGLAIDASRYAARRAAADHRIGAVVADAWSALPIRDLVASTVLSVFAPRDVGEIARVLCPGGLFVAVTPEPEHLSQIRERLGLLVVDPGKPERLVAAVADRLDLVDRAVVRGEMALTRAQIHALVRMGPSSRHIPPARRRAGIDLLDPTTTVTLAVTVAVFRK